ncbi:MAG: tRNA (N(6)-L-threonylcarbamoyladenosine(37)-C(2))-methylthiotransferase MtaB [Clostridia bacterium]|nr:tRNA (N(6)-L-threonylcarbamoyladenosine(37)-C(2))-methylthiotransferase MtaB [Clostridia bacterium]
MKACVFTLGCKMNEVESMSLGAGLEELGYEVTDELCSADLYLLNTCAVTKEAEKKSRQAVARVRKFNPTAPVIVFGCAASNDPEAFFEKEGVVFVSGAQGKDKVLSLLGQEGIFPDSNESIFSELPAPKQLKTRAFVRIQDGCDHFCSYCLIPYLRGRSRSRGAAAILQEIKAATAKEIVLTGIDISSYRDGETDLGKLLYSLKGLPVRVRLGSLEPQVITREFLERVKGAGNIMPHFHLSLQSGSDRVLKSMNRHYTRAEYLEKCALIREYFENAAITTDIIVGFSGEREEDFEESVSIIEEAGLARVHVFPYSPREGTAAFKKADTPADIKKARTAKLLAAADEAERRFLQKQIGKTAEVLFEDDGGYTENYVRVHASGAKEGELKKVKIIRIKDHGVEAVIEED